MTFLTLFAAPKPFTDPHIAIIQRNAIQSWLRLGPDVAVILVGEETGLDETAADLGVRHISDVSRNAEGTPQVNSIFSLARAVTDSPLLAYLNADILVLPDFVAIARQIANQAERFLVIGQRWDLDVAQELDFGVDWDLRLRALVRARGRLHPPAGSDYFIFPRALFTDMPAFAIGRAGWDNWMIYHAHQQSWPVVDVTPSLVVIHQSHDYSHLPGGRPHYNLEESNQNMTLAGGPNHMYIVLDSDKQFRAGSIRSPRLTLLRLIRRAELMVMPPDGKRRGLRWAITRQLRRWRRAATGSRI